jgi:hypothetical protein
MKSTVHLPGARIKEFALICNDKIKSSSSKLDALRLIADGVPSDLEEFYLNAFEEADEISLSFVELLDQIIFEIIENTQSDDSVREYIVENLHARLLIYLDIFRGKEPYASTINRRMLTHDDAIIIRQLHFAEFVPLLIAEYYEQPGLSTSILRTLVSFDAKELLNFYYNIAKGENHADEKVLSLVGLKRFVSRFNFENLRSPENGEYSALIGYAASFDSASVCMNSVPEDPYSLLFCIHYIEMNIGGFSDMPSLTWMLRVLLAACNCVRDGSLASCIYKSVCSILVFIDTDGLRRLLHDDELAAGLIRMLDFFPREYFYKLGIKISSLESEFIRAIDRLTTSGVLPLDDSGYGIVNYILWRSASEL